MESDAFLFKKQLEWKKQSNREKRAFYFPQQFVEALWENSGPKFWNKMSFIHEENAAKLI